jgi:hypothetical protein
MKNYHNKLSFHFHHAAATATFFGFTLSDGPILINNVACLGSETRLIDCPATPATSDCGRSEEAGVRCEGDLPCTQGDIRLQSGTTTEGRVEICDENNLWGSVCDNTWDNTDARVACVQLGLPSTG